MLKRNDHARALRLIRAIALGATTTETALGHIVRTVDTALGRLASHESAGDAQTCRSTEEAQEHQHARQRHSGAGR